MRKFLTGAVLALTLVLVACADPSPSPYQSTPPVSTAERETETNQLEAERLKVTSNWERSALVRQTTELSRPGLIGYVGLIHYTGRVALYTPIEGRVMSSKKRLTSPQKWWMSNDGSMLGPAPSDTGTWGENTDSIYFWTTAGQYINTNMPYIYSTQPLRLTEAPIFEVSAPTDKITKPMDVSK